MTKIFQVIINLIRRHLVLFGIYRKYVKRFRRCESAENLCKHSSSDDNVIHLARVRRYRSVGETDCNWYRTKEYSCRELELRSMPCDTTDNWVRYQEDNMVVPCNNGHVNSAFVTNSAQNHHEDSNGNGYMTLNDNWVNDNESTITQTDFSLDGVIGSGGFGSVFLGRYGGRRVAVKSVRQSTKNREASRQSFRAEFNALYLRHENIVSVLATTAFEDFEAGAFIIMEYAGRRNLQQIINDPGRSLTPTRRTKYAVQIIRALHYTHSQGIAHLDVKPANVIVDSSDICRLADFGCSQRVHDGEGNISFTSPSHLTGTFAYRAPELLRGRPPTTKADIYSFGVTLWQMLTRETPFAGENHHVVIFGVVAHNLRPSLPDNNSNETWYESLVTKCWEGCVSKRPTAEEILVALENRVDAGESQT